MSEKISLDSSVLNYKNYNLYDKKVANERHGLEIYHYICK